MMAKFAITVSNSKRAKKYFAYGLRSYTFHTHNALKTDWVTETQKNSVGEIKKQSATFDIATSQTKPQTGKRKSTKKSTDYVTT